MKNTVLHWTRYSITLKGILIGGIVLALLIPTALIMKLINEREYYAEQVRQDIYSSWGTEQLINGPVLTIPFKTIRKNGDEVYESVEYAHFLPDMLHIEGEVTPSYRYRSLYEVLLYEAGLKIRGSFHHPSLELWSVPPHMILWDEAYLSLGIPDLTGIQNAVQMHWNDQVLEAESGVPDRDLFASGLTFRVKLEEEGPYTFNTELILRGSESLLFIPAGKETGISLLSSCPDPSFHGNFLPDEREVSDRGFTATWNVLHVNRNFPQQWKGAAHSTEGSEFGVSLLVPVDEYRKNMRSVKYSLMFTGLTFVVFFFAEILYRKRIHAFQYLLAGSALVVFYILLLSLSEHLRYNLAYLIASLATLLQVSLYAASSFRSGRMGLITGLVLAILYAFLFSLIQLADYSLLLGSIGLFLTLAILMYTTRNINWYEKTLPPEEDVTLH